MNLEGKYLAVWLHDEAAKLLLGLPQPTTESRWAVLGVAQPDAETPNGLWIEVDVLQERKGPDAKVIRKWKLQPLPHRVCLIRWPWIITVQVLGEPVSETPEFGFVPS